MLSTAGLRRLRGRKLSELHWFRFGLGGGLVSFAFLPILLSVLRALSGDDMLPLTKLLGTGALGLMFGTVAASIGSTGAPRHSPSLTRNP